MLVEKLPFKHPWDETNLGSVAVVEVGGTPSTLVPAFWIDGDIPWMSSGDVHLRRILDVPSRITALGLRSSNAKLIDPPTVAIALAGQGKTRGTVALTLTSLCTNQSVALIKGQEGILDTSYLFHALDARYEELRARSAGGGRAGLSKGIIEVIPLPLPPLPEQHRIAEILDTIDEAIARTDSLIQKLKLMKAGLLNDLLTCGLDENGELRDPIKHPEQFKDSVLGRIPREWEVVKLVDHISLPNGQVDPKQKPYCDWILIAPDHIESETGRIINYQTAAEQNAISGKYAFQSGDVLYSKIRPYLRKAVLADAEGLCSADMYPFRPASNVDSKFLLAVILGQDFSRFASAVSMRSGFPKINREELSEYRLALPLYEEQQTIAQILDTHDTRIRTEETYLNKLKRQKQGLMHDLLTGKVRVT